MACKNVCKVCDKLVFSQAVNFSSANNTLLINIPQKSYNDNCKYCIVIAQSIPNSVTISATVLITIGTSPVTYQLVNRDGSPALATEIQTRTRYSTVVDTNATTGVFRLLNNNCRCKRSTNALESIPAPIV